MVLVRPMVTGLGGKSDRILPADCSTSKTDNQNSKTKFIHYTALNLDIQQCLLRLLLLHKINRILLRNLLNTAHLVLKDNSKVLVRDLNHLRSKRCANILGFC